MGVALAYPLLNVRGAAALLSDPPTFPGQVGNAVSYLTAKGTPCWLFYAYAGTAGNPNDDYHYAKVIVPQSLDVTVATPTVFVVHGATATEECLTKGGGFTPLVQTWLDLGWPVIATREGTTINPKNGNGKLGRWGNEPSRQGMADAWRWTSSAWTPDPHGFLVFGFSMGGVAGLNFAAEARRQRLPIAAMYSVDGATNLAYCAVNTPSFHGNIKTAYALPNKYIVGDPSWIAKVDIADGGHDPQKFMPQLLSFPLRLAASGNDPTVNKANNSTDLYNTLLASGWNSELGALSYTGSHCAKTHFRPTDVNPFFIRAIQRPNQPPVAAFTFVATGTQVAFDASASSDADGYVVGYAWDFGDGTTDVGATVDHDFGVSGTYSVTLVVTDDLGATGTMSASVPAIVPKSPPVAAFSFVVDGTVVDFDASASSDSDGSIVAYDWNFGDGTTDSGVTPEHDFGISGTYQVALTVTDDGGAPNTLTQTVVIP